MNAFTVYIFTLICISSTISYGMGPSASTRIRAFYDEAVIVTDVMARPSNPIFLYLLGVVQYNCLVLFCFVL